MDIVRRDPKDMGITWDEAEELATDRAEWRQRLQPNVSIWMRDELRSKVKSHRDSQTDTKNIT